jgi:hypothetical protein
MVRVYQNNHYNPQDLEIREKAAERKIRKFSPDFMADIAAKFAGEKQKNIVELQEWVDSLPPPEPPNLKPDDDGDYRLRLSGGYTKDKAKAQREEVEFKQKRRFEKVRKLQKFIEGLPSNIPGRTPLEKAAAVVKHLSKACSECAGKTPPPGGSPDPTEDLPIWAEDERHMKRHLEELQEASDLMEQMDESDWDALNLGDNPEEVFSNMRGQALQMLKLEQFMKLRTGLKTKPRSKLERDPDGDVIFYDSSSSISDLSNVEDKGSLLSKRNPAFELMQGKADIPQKFRKSDSTPFISIIIDRSGSMSGEKRNMALGILLHICKEADKGNTQALVAFYEEGLRDGPFHLHKEMDPIKWFKDTARSISFDLGGTEVGVAAHQILEAYDELVQEREDLMVDSSQKHLVIIHDGQDDVGNFSVGSLNGAKLHSFMLLQHHPVLQEISEDSGGAYHLIGYEGNEVEAYDYEEYEEED